MISRMWIVGCAFVTAMCATPALAQELPISGLYGDELGCARLNMGPNDIDEPGGINVFPTEIVGYEWSCTFMEVWSHGDDDDRVFGVQGLCGAEGIPFMEQYVLQFGRDDRNQLLVLSAQGEPRWELRLCEAEETPGRKG